MSDFVKDLFGRTLSGRHGAQAALLKLATYPRFYQWKKLHEGMDEVSGAQREKRNKLFAKIAASKELLSTAIIYYEFGVHKGDSFTWWIENNTNPNSIFFGFDSFEGLPEDWLDNRQKGMFSTGGQIPLTNDTRATFVKGWFHETLPTHLAPLQGESRRVVHMDADLYRSTIYPLMLIGPFMIPGDILIFDEFADSIHEFRAFEDFCSIFNLNWALLGATRGFNQTAFVIV